MLVGGMVVMPGLSFWGALGAITCGVLLAMIAYTITATMGVDYGLQGQVSMIMVYRVARRQMGGVVSAHDRFDLLVCLSDRGELARPSGDPRPLDRSPHSLVAVSPTFTVLHAIVAMIGST